MSYEVGDKVKLKTWEQLRDEFRYDGDKIIVYANFWRQSCVIPEMKEFLGNVYVIDGVEDGLTWHNKTSYNLKDVGNFSWLDEMIEKKVEDNEDKTDKPIFEDSFGNTVEQWERVLVGDKKNDITKERIVVSKLEDRKYPYICVDWMFVDDYKEDENDIPYHNFKYIKKIKETIKIDDKEYDKEEVEERLSELQPVN